MGWLTDHGFVFRGTGAWQLFAGDPALVALSCLSKAVLVMQPLIVSALRGRPPGADGRPVVSPNAAGVSMGHLHYHVRDTRPTGVLGCAGGLLAARLGRGGEILYVVICGRRRGRTNGSVVTGVPPQSFAKVGGGGLHGARPAQFPGSDPSTRRANESSSSKLATNLTFILDSGQNRSGRRSSQSPADDSGRVPPRSSIRSSGADVHKARPSNVRRRQEKSRTTGRPIARIN